MPQVSDIVNKKKFKKRSYRPWDLSGSSEESNLPLSEKEITENQIEENNIPQKDTLQKPFETSPLNNAIETNSKNLARNNDLPEIKENFTSQASYSQKPSNHQPSPHAITNLHPEPSIGYGLDNKIELKRETIGNDWSPFRKQLNNNSITLRQQLDNEIGAGSKKNIIRKLSGVQSKIFNLIVKHF